METPNTPDRPGTCAHCGERLGVYEPLIIERPDGSTDATSYLNLTATERSRPPRLWHARCHAARDRPLQERRVS